jgi:hypothetical protein
LRSAILGMPELSLNAMRYREVGRRAGARAFVEASALGL